MKILVTGGTGFIGSHLAESALRQGHVVNILGLAQTPADRANADLLQQLGARVYVGSITNTQLCRDALAGITHVYHLAVAMREAGMGDDYFKKVNLEGTRELLKSAHDAGVQRLIYCGTIGIFGHRFSGVADENSPEAPGNIYEQTKLAAEKLALDFGRQHALEVASLRPADVYGPRDQRLLKLFRAVEKGQFPLFGNGDGRRHMIYVDDVVAAFEAALTSRAVLGMAVILAGPHTCTLRELVEEIRKATGNVRFGVHLPLRPALLAAALTEDVCKLIRLSPPIYRRRMDFYTSDCAFDISRAKNVLNWSPTVRLSEGITRTLNAYRESATR